MMRWVLEIVLIDALSGMVLCAHHCLIQSFATRIMDFQFLFMFFFFLVIRKSSLLVVSKVFLDMDNIVGCDIVVERCSFGFNLLVIATPVMIT